MSPEWKIDCIAITGDVGYQGHWKDYVLAKNWLHDLTNCIGIGPESIVICPGNHDVDQKNLAVPDYPANNTEAKIGLKVENLKNLTKPFTAFQQFQKVFCQTPFHLGLNKNPDDQRKKMPFYENFLVGQKIIKGLNFISLNSAWYCRDSKTDERKLWLGRPQLYVMEAAGQLMDYEDYIHRPITITLFHHPPSFLHPDDGLAHYGAYELLIDRSNFILTGHNHVIRPDFDQRRSHARTLVNGCVYDNPDYGNICSLLKIDKIKHHFWYKRILWNGQTWDCPVRLDDEGDIFQRIMDVPRFKIERKINGGNSEIV